MALTMVLSIFSSLLGCYMPRFDGLTCVIAYNYTDIA